MTPSGSYPSARKCSTIVAAAPMARGSAIDTNITPTAAGPARCHRDLRCSAHRCRSSVDGTHLRSTALANQARLCRVAGEIERIDPLGLQPVDEFK